MFSSGSFFGFTGVHIESTQSFEWKCHYCGGEVDSKSKKCPNCGGEKRNVIIRHSGYAKIAYVDDSPKDVFDVVGRESLMDKIKRKFRRDG